MNETKECPVCKESINAGAKKCPHCLSWQSRWKFDNSNIKHQLILAVVMMGAMGLVFYGFFGSVFSPESISDYRGLINVKNSKVSHSESNCGMQISVIGVIENSSDVQWRDIHFEAQFFNEKNELIDTLSDKVYDLVLLPISESTFKVTGSAAREVSAYKTHKVMIKHAREANAFE